MPILVTGGAGYIGSVTSRLLVEKGHDIVVFDNLSRGHREAVPDGVPFERIDLTKIDELRAGFQKYVIDGVIHFAAFAFVGESVRNPRLYHDNNVGGGINLLEVMTEFGVKAMVFSSSCSIYGNAAQQPITEATPANPINPYAETKVVVEQLIADLDQSHGLRSVRLRYFNAGGAHPDGTLGESHDPEEHLIPLAIATAFGKRETFSIFGNDYPTPDGTCVRDYVHVCDIARAHLDAWEHLRRGNDSVTVNLGSGRGYSVKEIIAAVERATGRKIVTEATPRREGDPAILVADNRRARELFRWQPTYTLEETMATAVRWYQHPRY